MTATSVSITVQTLHELGHLKGKIGTTILSAAIIDDVIGILVLTFVVSFKDPNTKISSVCMNTILFFVMAIVGGVICYYLFRYIDKKYPHQRRIPIFGLALCFGMAYIAEEWFGIADITGAYVAGIILCSIHDSAYIARKMDINAYMIFQTDFLYKYRSEDRCNRNDIRNPPVFHRVCPHWYDQQSNWMRSLRKAVPV